MDWKRLKKYTWTGNSWKSTSKCKWNYFSVAHYASLPYLGLRIIAGRSARKKYWKVKFIQNCTWVWKPLPRDWRCTVGKFAQKCKHFEFCFIVHYDFFWNFFFRFLEGRPQCSTYGIDLQKQSSMLNRFHCCLREHFYALKSTVGGKMWNFIIKTWLYRSIFSLNWNWWW